MLTAITLYLFRLFKEETDSNSQNKLKKKTLSTLLKYCKILLIHPGRIFGQNTNLIGLYCGKG